MTSPVGWDVDDPASGAWVDLFASYARTQSLGAGDPHLVPAWRGDDQVIPGRRGRVPTPSTIDAGKIGIAMVLRGANADGTVPADQEAAFLDNWRALKRLLYRPTGMQLRRRLRYPEGVASHVATAKLLPSSFTPGTLATLYGKVILDLSVLSGTFYDEASTTIAPGTVTITGDAPTRRMTITLPRAGTLTNGTLGVSVTVTVAATLDVEAATATAGLDTMSWSGDNSFFLLAPGSNTITWSGDNAPTGFTATAVGSGGTFAAATYFWQVTATNASGETVGSVEASAAIALNGSANLAWNAVPGATGYKVYRATSAGGESTSPALVTTITSGATVTYTDTGTATSAGAVPTGSPSIAYRGAHL